MAVDTRISRRLATAQEAVNGEGVDLLLCTPSADLTYLAGYPAHASERPTMLAILSEGEPFIVMPQLEAPRLAGRTDLGIVPYGETESAFDALHAAVGSRPVNQVAISDQAWALHVLGLQSVFPDATFRPAGVLLRALRMRKQEYEIDLMRQAGSVVDRAFDIIVTRGFSGRSEREVAQDLGGVVSELGLSSSWGPIVASGPNSSSPHHMTGDRVIELGDMVVLDFGGALDGYQADTTRTVHVGAPKDEQVRVYEVVRQAQEAAVQSVRPGIRAQDVDRAARSVIDSAGYGDFFIHRTGHGIGLDTHEEPYIVQGNELMLEPGMTFSVEPGVYLPGKFGVRIEDIVAVTEGGSDRLNNATRHLVQVE